MMDDIENLKLVLGVCLLVAGYLGFSLWRERLLRLKDEERVQFLMYNVMGGSWILAVFAVCGGCFFLLEPFFK